MGVGGLGFRDYLGTFGEQTYEVQKLVQVRRREYFWNLYDDRLRNTDVVDSGDYVFILRKHQKEENMISS